MLNRNDSEFRAGVSSIIPISAKSQLSQLSSCYLGVSLETPAFRKPMLNATVQWIDANFKKCALLIGDSLHRLTIQITKDLPPDAATLEAYNIGSMFLEENQDLFLNYTECKFEIVRCSDIQQSSTFLHYKSYITNIFNSHKHFSDSIRKSALAFIERRRPELESSIVTKEKKVALSCQYIIEELAIFSCLVEAGWKVEIYPGSELPVLIEIARGKHLFVPEPLKERINVALKIKQ